MFLYWSKSLSGGRQNPYLGLWQNIVLGLVGLWQNIKLRLVGLWQNIKLGLVGLWQNIKLGLVGMWQNIELGLVGLWQNIKLGLVGRSSLFFGLGCLSFSKQPYFIRVLTTVALLTCKTFYYWFYRQHSRGVKSSYTHGWIVDVAKQTYTLQRAFQKLTNFGPVYIL